MNPRGPRCLFLIVDGLGDRPSEVLGGRTPLEAARTPALDALAARGRYGLVDPIGPGVVPNTDSGIGLLLGLPPDDVDALRRGPVEAAGAGLSLSPGDVALRANFAWLDKRDGRAWVRDRRAGRIAEGTSGLEARLDGLDLGEGVTVRFRATDQHRGVVVLSGEGLHPAVSDTDPGDTDIPCALPRCRALRPGAERTAAALDRLLEVAHARLDDHPVNAARRAAGKPPANGLITRGAGAGFLPGNVVSGRGLSAATVAGCNTVLGLSRMFGFRTIESPRFTADEHTDVAAKVSAALDATREYDLVYLHYKAPDLCAHDRRPADKCASLERFDHALRSLPDAGVIVALASDHTTDSGTGLHTADPVPVLLYDPRDAEARPLRGFGETACKEGNLPVRTSASFLREVLDRLGPAGPR